MAKSYFYLHFMYLYALLCSEIFGILLNSLESLESLETLPQKSRSLETQIRRDFAIPRSELYSAAV